MLLLSCSPLKNVSTKNISYDGTDIYVNNELAATLSTIEIALDDDKIVKEATFKLTDEKFNPYIINMIKFVHLKRSDMEIEIELIKNE